MRSLVVTCLTVCLIVGAQSTSMTTIMGNQFLTVNLTNPGLSLSIYRKISSASPTTPPPSTTSSSTTLPTSSSTASSTTPATTTPAATTPAPVPGNTDYINLTISGIREMDSAGVAVNPQTGHMIGSAWFLTQMYNQTTAVAYTALISNTVSASCNQFWASPLNGLNSTLTSLNVTICTTSSAGAITSSTENEPVLAGQLIIYLTVSQWEWASAGASLEMTVTLAVATGRVITRTRGSNSNTTMRCEAGGSNSKDAYVDVSGMAVNDGLVIAQTIAPTLNPSAGGANVNVTVRLPKATTSSMFYMLVEPGWTAVKGGSGVVGAAPRMLAVNVWVMFVAFILGVVAL